MKASKRLRLRQIRGGPVSAPSRPAQRWYGGKFLLRDWIISHFPPHDIYVEPFGGAASVLLGKARARAEIYNDLDDQIVTFFRVLQVPAKSAVLIEKLRHTPFARKEFQLAYQPSEDPVEIARRLTIRSFMGFGANAHASTERGHRSTGFRANSNRIGTTPAQDWVNYPDALEEIRLRMLGVVLESQDALAVFRRFDAPATLTYFDPPYLAELRSPSNKYDIRYRMYRHELDTPGHVRLLEAVRGAQGFVAISGYPGSPLYEEALHDWRREEKETYADGARPRTEVLWLNPACAAALDRQHAGHGMPLFGGAMAAELSA